jgi:peptidoglycan/xylan/chitin deacetylase (PgdA/CDA1 family)
LIDKRTLATKIIEAADILKLLDIYVYLRRRTFRSVGRILLYHRVDEPDNYPWAFKPTRIRYFEEEMKYLRKRYDIISLNQLVRYIKEAQPLPLKSVVVTIDDGFKDTYRNAYPILKKYNIPATVFLATGRINIDELFWSDKAAYAIWNTNQEILSMDELGVYPILTAGQRRKVSSIIKERLREMPAVKKNFIIERLVRTLGVNIPAHIGKEFSLTWDEVRVMSKNGINFGAHTVTHPDLTKISLEEARTEIMDSKNQIEKELDKPCFSFAYPLGRSTNFNDDIKNILRECGFSCALTSFFSLASACRRYPYELGRVSPGPNYQIFKLSISGLYFDLERILKKRSILSSEDHNFLAS